MSIRSVAVVSFLIFFVFAGVGCPGPSVESQNPRIAGRDDVLEDWGIRGGSYEKSPETDGRAQVCLDIECLDVPGLAYPVGELTEAEKEALTAALDDEYRLLAVFRAAVRRHGNVRPFAMIVRAEERHVTALAGLFDKYGLDVPNNAYLGNVQARETVKGECEFSVGIIEEGVRQMNDELMPAVTGRRDVSRVFGTLLNDFESHYLPAVSECAQ